MQTGSMSAFACTVVVSGNAVKTREEVVVDCVNDVYVVDESEIVIGIEVVNVVRLEERTTVPEVVALTGVREVAWGLLEAVVAESLDVEGIAEISEDGYEGVTEEDGEVGVGKKVEPSLVDHHLF